MSVDLVKNIANNIADKLCRMPLSSMTAGQEQAIQFAIEGCNNIVRMRGMEDEDNKKSLLQHLTSLTVAERETILRVAEISALLKRDSAKDFQLNDLSEGAVALVLNAETCLRLAGPSMVALSQTSDR